MEHLPPLIWPHEYWQQEDGQIRPICRCSNPECSMGLRGLAYTWLDVYEPSPICRGCDAEFEFTDSDCTYAANRAAKGKSAKGKGKGKGMPFLGKGYGKYGNFYIGDKSNDKGAGKGGGDKGKGKGYIGKGNVGKGNAKNNNDYDYDIYDNNYGKGNVNKGLNEFQEIYEKINIAGADILSPEQSTQLKCALETLGRQKFQGPIKPAKVLSPLQELKVQQKHLQAELSSLTNHIGQTSDNYIKAVAACKTQLINLTAATKEREALKEKLNDIVQKIEQKQDMQAQDKEQALIQATADHLAHQKNIITNAAIIVPEETCASSPGAPAGEEEAEEAAETAEDSGGYIGPDDDAEDIFQAKSTASDEQMPASAKRAAEDMTSAVVPVIAEASLEDCIADFAQINSAKKKRSTPRGEGTSENGE